MGVGLHSATHLCKIARERPFGGSILTLGVQDCHFTEQRILDMCAQYELPGPPKKWKGVINQREYFKNLSFIDGESFWKLLGFTEIVTLDVDKYEGADVIFDLNNPDPPAELRDRFDVVFDGGTLEHIFHLPNALAALHAMVKTGGRIIHQSPSSGHPDHGLYMFSPTFFHDYYGANGYAIRNSMLMLYPKNYLHEPSWYHDYTPGCLDALTFHFSIPDMSLLIGVAAEKKPGATCDVIPQQSWYQSQWRAALDEQRK